MPITILDYVKFQIGERDSYSAEDFYSTGVDIMGGCQGCAATLAGYNAYPSTSGYWKCADCIGDTGFATVEDFASSDANAAHDAPPSDDAGLASCPACGAVEHIREIREHAFVCGDCAAVWIT
jgi:hypothetical protein